MKTQKTGRFLALLLSLMMVLSGTTAPVFAEEPEAPAEQTADTAPAEEEAAPAGASTACSAGAPGSSAKAGTLTQPSTIIRLSSMAR